MKAQLVMRVELAGERLFSSVLSRQSVSTVLSESSIKGNKQRRLSTGLNKQCSFVAAFCSFSLH